jgi:hypothetical protein
VTGGTPVSLRAQGDDDVRNVVIEVLHDPVADGATLKDDASPVDEEQI